MTSKSLCISNNELKILGIWDQPENFDEYSLKNLLDMYWIERQQS